VLHWVEEKRGTVVVDGFDKRGKEETLCSVTRNKWSQARCRSRKESLWKGRIKKERGVQRGKKKIG